MDWQAVAKYVESCLIGSEFTRHHQQGNRHTYASAHLTCLLVDDNVAAVLGMPVALAQIRATGST